MRQNAALAHLGGAAMLFAVTGWSGAATAQVNCETIPPGAARTDCYIGLSRIARQNSEIADQRCAAADRPRDLSLRDGQVAEEEGGSTIIAHQATGCRPTGAPVQRGSVVGKDKGR